MSKIDHHTAQIVANNLAFLMKHYGLTVYGIEAGTGIEVHTINRILSKRTNISTGSAKKLADFFGITVDVLFSSKPIKVKKIDNTPSIKRFYEENPLNNKYFQSRQKENVVARFLRTVLVNDPYLNEGRRAGNISSHIKNLYKKDFNRETVNKELARMYQEGILQREDKTGKGSVYYYSLVEPITK